MATAKLEPSRLLSIQAINRLVPNFQGKLAHKKTTWTIIGMVSNSEGAVPFLLHYSDGGLTHWYCKRALAPNLRRKILAQFREVRLQRNHEIKVETIELTDLTWEVANATNHALFQEQLAKWKALAGVVDPEMIDLEVPFADKDKVKGLGAKWNGRKWQVPKQDDMTPFEKWLIK